MSHVGPAAACGEAAALPPLLCADVGESKGMAVGMAPVGLRGAKWGSRVSGGTGRQAKQQEGTGTH